MDSPNTTRRPVVWYLAAHYDNPGGIEAYLLHYATELRRQGFDARLVVFARLPIARHRCLAALEARGIPIVSLYEQCAARARRRMMLCYVPWALERVRRRQAPAPDLLMQWALKREAVSLLARMIHDERPDVLHVKGRVFAEAWAALPANRTVVHVATRGLRDPSWTDAEVDAFGAFANRAARVFAPGTEVAQNVRREFGIERNVDVVFTMAPDEAAGEAVGMAADGAAPSAHDEGPRRFGMLARLVEGKGIPETLEALTLLRDRLGREIPFTFAGEGPLESDIQAFAANHGLRGVSRVPVETPAGALLRMDALVLPSRSEAMPLVLVEALMCGRPCIATTVGGVYDLLRDGREGVLLPAAAAPNDIAAAIEHMDKLPANDFDALRRNARLRYEEKCRPEAVGAGVAAHYRHIIRESPWP